MEANKWIYINEMRTPQSVKNQIIAIESYIAKRGLKLTRLRKIVLEVLITEKEHLTVAQIHLLACKNKHDFAMASIYRNINTLVAIGVVEAHQFKKGHATYELARAKPHDHLIDLDSGRIIEFQNTALDQLKAQIAKQHGYRADACRIEFYAYPIDKASKTVLRNEA